MARSTMLALWILLGGSLFGCIGAIDHEQNKRIVEGVFNEVLNHGQYELCDKAYAPNFIKHVDGRSETLDD